MRLKCIINSFILVIVSMFFCFTFVCAEVAQLSRELPLDGKYVSNSEKSVLEIREWLNHIIFPRVEFKQEEIRAIIMDLSGKVHKYSPDGKRISFVVSNDIADYKISVSLVNKSFPEVVNEICEKINGWWSLDHYAIAIMSDNDKATRIKTSNNSLNTDAE